MGEIADMMLEGVLCECCGVALETEGEGFPSYCSEQCARDRGANWWLEANSYPLTAKQRVKTFRCNLGCKKPFLSRQSLSQHMRDKHGKPSAAKHSDDDGESVGDYWRAHREHKKKVRATWVECGVCAGRYGGNGTKNPPGEPCRNCGTVNP